jgi:hypothetical protein
MQSISYKRKQKENINKYKSVIYEKFFRDHIFISI